MSHYNKEKPSSSSSGKNRAFSPPEATPTLVPRFDYSDLDKAMQYLDDNGYVVIRNVATPDEVQKGIGLAWSFIEGLDIGVKRNDVNTWNTKLWPDPFRKGILTGDGVGQSEFLWFCRGLPTIQNIYRKIWGVDDIITSFDGFCFYRAFEYNEDWKTSSAAWYHTDQNAFLKPDKVCVQGFLNLIDCGLDDGGLVVVPGSHKIFNDIFSTRPEWEKLNHFVPMSGDANLWNNEIKAAGLRPIKICCGPGDFVLWDSRTIHCNAPPRTLREKPKDNSLLSPRRIVAYVCMTPSTRLSENVHALRIQAYHDGDTTSHWPEEVFTPTMRKNKNKGYTPVDLDESLRKLIPM